MKRKIKDKNAKIKSFESRAVTLIFNV